MDENIVLDFMAKLLEARMSKDEANVKSLIEASKQFHVTLDEVGIALDTILEDILAIVEHQQILMEARLVSIVGCMDEVTQRRIIKEFDEVDDDLLYDKKGAEIYDPEIHPRTNES